MHLVDLLKSDLADIRRQLLEVAEKLDDQILTWQPYPGMKTALEMLREIGECEDIVISFLKGHPTLDPSIKFDHSDLPSTLEQLGKIRNDSLIYLNEFSDNDLLMGRINPAGLDFRKRLLSPWFILDKEHYYPLQLWNAIGRHEYYHVGQLVSYRWLLGKSPYVE